MQDMKVYKILFFELGNITIGLKAIGRSSSFAKTNNIESLIQVEIASLPTTKPTRKQFRSKILIMKAWWVTTYYLSAFCDMIIGMEYALTIGL